ncbi:MAG: hypothetical protein E7142_08690 [Rikenellaceae bacterium]|nr:hypothetical protein [Rikenellaceae bacterium]
MKRFFQFLMASAFVVSMQGCSNEPSGEISSAVELKLKGEIQTPMSRTRVDVNGFETSDKVGVYVSSTSSLASQGNVLDNIAYSYSNGDLVAPEDGKVYWDSEDTRLSIYAYYPYSATVEDNSAYEFSVETNQSESENFYNSDFIAAKAENIAPQEAPVSLTFQHSLSKINVSLVAGKGITADELAAAEKSFTIGGLVTGGTINLATSKATAGTTKATITPLESNGKDYSAIVYPQSGAVTFYMELDGEIFSYTTNVNFAAGYQYQFNLAINTWESPEMTLSTTTIEPWDDGDDHSGTMSNALSFPDPAFKAFLLNADKYATFNFNQEPDGKVDANGDGKISKEEAEAVLFLNAAKGQEITQTSFTNVKGIEYFVNLQGINLDSHTSLTSIDVSKNTKLTYLKVSACPVASIDVSNNTSLEWLYCYNCGLTELDLSNNPNLKYVDCDGNTNLTTIYIAEGVNYQTWSIQSGVTPTVKSN